MNQILDKPKSRVLFDGDSALSTVAHLRGSVQPDLQFRSARFLDTSPDPIETLPNQYDLYAWLSVRGSDCGQRFSKVRRSLGALEVISRHGRHLTHLLARIPTARLDSVGLHTNAKQSGGHGAAVGWARRG